MVDRNRLRAANFAPQSRRRRYAAGPMYDSAPAADMIHPAGIDPAILNDFMPRVDPERVTVRVASPLFRRFWAKGIAAVTLPNGVFVQPSVMKRFRRGTNPDRVAKLIIHELMHLEQWRRLGGLRHSTQYMYDYLRNRRSGGKHWDSYRAIRLEIEARAVAAYLMEGRTA